MLINTRKCVNILYRIRGIDMNEKINITKENGTNVETDIICFLENNTGKRYLYYTLNEIVGAGANSTAKIYVSKIKQDNAALDAPITDAEWDKLKGYMSDALKATENPEVKYLPISELVNPVSVSERAIAMPISYDYINKQRGIYAESMAKLAAQTDNVAPSNVEAATTEPTVTPVSEEPVVTNEPVSVEPTPVVTENPNVFDTVPQEPVSAPVVESPVNEEQPVASVTPADEDNNSSQDSGIASTLKPINLEEIEAKYNQMIETVNQLKAQELEAAKRYNATLELSEMHTEQHANYVQNEQSKEIAANPVPTEPKAPEATVNETPQSAPTMAQAPVSNANIETNWFDMPSN